MTSIPASSKLSADVLEAVRGVIGDRSGFVPLHAPTLGGNAWAYVKECLDTGWVSSAGAYVNRFEEAAAAYTGADHAVATVTGTAALHVALLVAGVTPDDEVIAPSLTFVATANAIRYTGAWPHFVDVEAGSLGVDAPKLATHLDEVAERRDDGVCVNRRTGRRIAAIVPMHTFGHPMDLDALAAVAGRYDLPIIEDAAESLGSYYKGRHTGTTGRLGILSFNGNKTITTGGGGMILTDDEALAAEARHCATTAKKPHAWEYEHDRVGYNYRLPNLNAALGVAQFEALPELLACKRQLAEQYVAAFDAVTGVRVLTEPDYARSNYWLNALILDEPSLAQRNVVLAALNEAGLQSRPIWQPMHQLPMYADCPRADLATTEDLALRVVNVPSSADLGDVSD